MEEPGLFRISGQQQVINEIRQQWDKGQSPTFDAKTSPHNVAGLLKLYLREMPEPLFTHARYPLFIDSASKPTYEARVEFTSGLLQGLPPTFFKASQQVLGLLYNIASNSEVNNMDAKNLATVFVQCIIRPKVQSFDYFVTEAPPLNSTLTFIIENYPVLFGVPGKCLPPRQPKGAAAAAAAAAAAGATSTDPTATAAAPGAPGDIPPPPGAGADAVPPPPPPVLGGEEETPDPGVDPAVWAFRSESYKVITQLYELTNVIIDELANVQSVSELVFLASVVWEARTAITKELTETLVPPAFTLVAVQPPASRARLQQLLAEHGDTISRFTEDIAGYVEQMGQYMSEVETLEPLRPVDARFRFLAAVLAQSERVTRRHEGVSPTATATDDTVDTAVLDNFLPDDVPSTTEDPAAAGALPPPPPPPLPSDGDVAAPGTELPPPPPPPAADEPALGVPPPPVPAVPPQLGVPPAVPPAAAAAPEPQLGLPPVAPAAAAAPEPQLGLPPVAPAAAATAPEPQLGLPPVAPAAAPEPQLGLPPAAPASQTPAGGQNTQFVPAMANTAALNKTWAPGVSAAAPPPAAKTAEAPVNTLLLATGGRKPAGNIGTSQRRAPGTGNAKNRLLFSSLTAASSCHFLHWFFWCFFLEHSNGRYAVRTNCRNHRHSQVHEKRRVDSVTGTAQDTAGCCPSA